MSQRVGWVRAEWANCDARLTLAVQVDMAFKGAGKAGGTGGKFDQEDRSRDWYCPKCNERNFMKRAECFKCKGPKPKDSEGKPPPGIPQTGTTLNGMVKSYNRKGFGFIMALNGSPACQDIYYSRENLHPLLQTRDIPGEHVTFEIQCFPDGKLVAKNVRPHGESESQLRAALDKHPPHPPPSKSKGTSKGGRGADEEDRSRDWNCERCGERNFVKRFECFKCKEPRKITDDEGFAPGPTPRRTFSPHAGSRAVREALAGRGGNDRSRSGRRNSSSDSSSSSSHKKKKQKKGKKRKRSSSSSRSSSKSSKSSKAEIKADEADSAAAQEPAAAKDPEVEKAKAASLEKLLKLQGVEPLQERMKEYRQLLRQWHPDKNPDKVEVATAVFQFLQKAKPMIEK